MARCFPIPAWFSTIVLGCLLCASPIAAQDKSPKPAAKDAVPAAADAAKTPAKSGQDAGAEDAFEAKFAEWKALIMRLRQLRSDYQTADEAERKAMVKQWDSTIAEAENVLPELIDVVLAAYQAAPNEDRVKTNFLAKVLADYVSRDLYEPAVKIGSVLINNDCDLTEVFHNTGIAAYALNDYDLMAKIIDKGEAKEALWNDPALLRKQLELAKEYWKVEQEVRAKEAQANDLPRVKLTTTKGDIIIELFENEAPETTANFISLVKKGFYDELTFHRVISGFMAQGGCPQGDGSGGPGYRIYDECNKPGFRRHFRGAVSMAKTNAPNSGGSQFFIAYRPLFGLDGKHTVFGRVIEGMDVVCRLQRRNAEEKKTPLPEPDRIIKAEVLRDRGHEYLPHKVE